MQEAGEHPVVVAFEHGPVLPPRLTLHQIVDHPPAVRATVDEVAHFIHPRPSLSENFGEAVLALTGRSLNG